MKCADCPVAGRCVREWTGHTAFCSRATRPAWRARIVELSADPPAEAAYPPLMQQASNLLGAVGRVVAAAVRGEPVRVPAEVLESRRAACLPCEHNGRRGSGGIRCTKCGCGGAKLGLAIEQCPLDPPKWRRWEEPADAS